MSGLFTRINKLYLFIPLWITINTAIGTLVSFFFSITFDYPFVTLFLLSQVWTHLISTFATLTGYLLGYRYGRMSFARAIPLTVMGTLLATSLSSMLCYLLTSHVFRVELFQTFREYVIYLGVPILIINIIITLTASTIERLKVERLQMADEMRQLKLSKNSRPRKITFMDRGDHHVLDPSVIVYLSSHGRKTCLHTNEGDHEFSKLMKDIEAKLPPETFVRIHKQYIINAEYISKLQYYSGGRYIVFLGDDEKTTLPVSRNSVQMLKARIGIDTK